MVTDWGWDEFDQKVEQEVAEIQKGLGDAMLDESRQEATVNDLLDAGIRESQESNELRAAAAFRVAATIDSRCWRAHYNLGWQYLMIGNRLPRPAEDKPAPSGDESPKPEPPSPAVGERAAFYNHALRSLKRVLQLNIELAKGWCLLGQTQYYLGDYDDSRASLRKAIELDPTGEAGKMAQESLTVVKEHFPEDDA